MEDIWRLQSEDPDDFNKISGEYRLHVTCIRDADEENCHSSSYRPAEDSAELDRRIRRQ